MSFNTPASLRLVKNKKRFIGIFLFLLLWASGPGVAVSGEDHDRVKALKESGEIIPLEQIIQTARKTHAGRLLEAHLENEHGRLLYELEFLDDRGVVRELYFEARTGEPFFPEQEEEEEQEQEDKGESGP